MIGLVVLYKRVLRRNVLWLDIAVFALVIAVAQLIFVQLVQELEPSGFTVAIAVVYLAAMLGAYAAHTLTPPAEPDIFVDPTNQRYGLEAHSDADRI